MKRTRRYEIEGIVLEIPLRYDAMTGIMIEEYPDFVQTPIYTKEGNRVLFTGEDACTLAESAKGGRCLDCGSCRHFTEAGEHSWIGLCRHPMKRNGIE